MKKSESVFKKWVKEDAEISVEYIADNLDILSCGETHDPIFTDGKFMLIVGDTTIEGEFEKVIPVNETTINIVLKNNGKIILKKC